MNERFALLGSGGHAGMINSCLIQKKIAISMVVTPQKKSQTPDFIHEISEAVDFLNDKQFMASVDPSNIILVNGLGFLPKDNSRKKIFEIYKNLNYRFYSLISRTAHVAPDIGISEGAQICNGAIVNNSVQIGENTLINSGAIVEHDVYIGCSSHVCPGSIICGGAVVGSNVYIGPGSVIAAGITVGHNSIIGANSTILRDVADGVSVYGIYK